MSIAMKAIEVTATLDEQGQLHLDEPLTTVGPGRVRLILLPADDMAQVSSMEDLAAKKPELAEICQQNDIAYLGVFGSIVRSEATADSDVDMVARFSKQKGLWDLIGIERELSEVLGRKVDLGTEDALNPYLRDRILAEVQVIYEESG